MSLLSLVLIGIATFIALRVLIYSIRFLSKEGILYKALFRITPVLEFVVWAAYVIWAVYVVFEGYEFKPVLMASMALILCLAIGWYLLRDLVSGMILKSENAFDTGQYLKAGTSEGIIRKVGYLSVDLETTEGENIKLPYSKLINQILIRPQTKSSHKFALIKLEITSEMPHPEIKQLLLKAINSTPWVVYSREPEIIIKPAENNLQHVEVRFVSFSDEHTSQLKNFLEKYCAEKFL